EVVWGMDTDVSTEKARSEEEAKALTERLYTQAQDQHSFSMVVEALLLRARFVTIDGDLQLALKYLDQARLTAEEKKLNLLRHKVDAEQKLFEVEFEKWQDLIQRNASLQERLEHARIEDYLKEVQKLVTLMKD
ncbi:MAG: hypothetical protein ACFFBD_21880, partial [Candidatus Hodarchaeota archaeon]